MNSKIRTRLTTVLATGLTAIVLVGSAFLTGAILKNNISKQEESVAEVPDKYYVDSNKALNRSSSSKLSLNEKLQLISGIWKSVPWGTDDSEEMSESDAKKLMWNKLWDLLNLNLYPKMSSDSMADYQITGNSYKISDFSFRKYTVTYWKFELEYKNETGKTNLEHDTICMLEDGTIFFAKMSHKKQTKVDFSYVSTPSTVLKPNVLAVDWRDYRKEVLKKIANQSSITTANDITDSELSSENKTTKDLQNQDKESNQIVLSYIITYKMGSSNLDVSGLGDYTGYYKYSNGEDTYRIIQSYGKRNYLYTLLPYEEELEE